MQMPVQHFIDNVYDIKQNKTIGTSLFKKNNLAVIQIGLSLKDANKSFRLQVSGL
jgi:hypothetical protein